MKKIRFLWVLVLLVGIGFVLGCENQQVETGTKNSPAEKEAGSKEKEGEKRELSGTLKDNIREVSMSAYRFAFDPDEVLVKKGEKVRLVIKSTDVTHGIAIRDLDIDRELPQGEEKVIEFTPQETGTLHFHCSVYCGSGHGRMHGKIIVKE